MTGQQSSLANRIPRVEVKDPHLLTDREREILGWSMDNGLPERGTEAYDEMLACCEFGVPGLLNVITELRANLKTTGRLLDREQERAEREDSLRRSAELRVSVLRSRFMCNDDFGDLVCELAVGHDGDHQMESDAGTHEWSDPIDCNPDENEEEE